jgi:hypothetical protein
MEKSNKSEPLLLFGVGNFARRSREKLKVYANPILSIVRLGGKGWWLDYFTA